MDILSIGEGPRMILGVGEDVGMKMLIQLTKFCTRSRIVAHHLNDGLNSTH
jgi:hypothetical protein